MRKHRAAIALSTTALVVAILGQTPIGNAAVGAVRVAVFAENAAKVNGIQASRRPMPGRLLALNAKGKLPSSVLPNQNAPREFTHTLVVSPDPADPVQAGRMLREVVSGIADPSALNAYLVKIEPGIYDLEASSLFMRPFVDIEGSGEGITTITSALGSGSGTVVATNNSELRNLTVKNTGEAGQQVVAIFSESASPRLSHVTAMASGGAENYGVHTSNGTVVMRYVTAAATGGSLALGVINFNSVMTVTNSAFSAADAGVNYGLSSTAGGSMRMNSSTVTASGGSVAIGMRTYNGSHTLADMTISATGGSESTGIYNGQKSSLPTVNVLQSRVTGSTNSIFSIGGAIKVGASQLTGPAGTFDIGTVACVLSFNGSYNPLGAGCT
ncbi:MAG TPA: hypothetical protein VFP03_09050 [Jiangellaceae bacterium]|nr:hypothetical protein [Jiangellaceae bacterium]